MARGHVAVTTLPIPQEEALHPPQSSPLRRAGPVSFSTFLLFSSCGCHEELEGEMRNSLKSLYEVHLTSSLCLPAASSKLGPLAPISSVPVPSNRRKVLAETVSALQLLVVCSALSGGLLLPTLAGFLAKRGLCAAKLTVGAVTTHVGEKHQGQWGAERRKRAPLPWKIPCASSTPCWK